MPSLGAIRPDEEPVPKTGKGVSLWAFESPRSRCFAADPAVTWFARRLAHLPRWSRGHDTGPSTRGAGFDSPSRYTDAR